MLRVLLRDLLLVGVVLIAGEVAVRGFLPHYARYIFTDGVTGGYPEEFNSYGLRDREFPRERPEGETRLLCLGNSTTRGAGVASEDTYPKQVQALLNSRNYPGRYFVINGSGAGKSLDHALRFLEQDGLAFDPEVVILGFSPSMLAVLSGAEDSTGAPGKPHALERDATWSQGFTGSLKKTLVRASAILNGSYAYVFAVANVRKAIYWGGVFRARMDRQAGAVFAYAFDVPGVDVDRVEAAYDVVESRLRDIKNLLDSRDVPVVVIGIPSRFEIGGASRDNKRRFDLAKIRISPLQRVGQYCRALRIPYIDLRTPLREQRRAMLDGRLPWNPLYIVRLDYTHLNERGLGIAAEELVRTIDANGWLQPDRDGD